MNAREIVKEVFIAPFYAENRHYVGTELEFPLIALSGDAINPAVPLDLLTYLQENGFTAEETDIYGRGIFLVNQDGDCLSFDNSYNNFEFAMAKSHELIAVSNRFYRLFALVQDFLLPRGHSLCGLGTNPRYDKDNTLPVEYPIYRTIRNFLSGFSGGQFHHYAYFPAWLSSVQTHLDITADRLPRALTLMAALDFARGMLFANGLPLDGAPEFSDTLCFRDYLWENSGFGSLADNTGPVCGTFETCDDIVDMFLKKSMFLQKDGTDYKTVPQVSLETYCDTRQEDRKLSAYLSFKNVEVTRRGTLEIRSDCAQPIGAAFAPPAFNLGIANRIEEAEQVLRALFDTLPPELSSAPDRNARLRRNVIYGKPLFAEEADVKACLCKLVSLAESGLKERGFGEEKLLAPLYGRAENLMPPAKLFKKRLQDGEAKAAILADFANPEKIF